MTSTLTERTITTITSSTYDALSATLGVVLICFLLILVLQREALRAFGGARSRDWMRALNVPVVPMLGAFGVIILLRLIALIS